MCLFPCGREVAPVVVPEAVVGGGREKSCEERGRERDSGSKGKREGGRETEKRDTCSYSQDGSSHTIGCRLVRCDCSPALPAIAERDTVNICTSHMQYIQYIHCIYMYTLVYIPSLDLAWEALADVVTSELRGWRGEKVKGERQRERRQGGLEEGKREGNT